MVARAPARPAATPASADREPPAHHRPRHRAGGGAQRHADADLAGALHHRVGEHPRTRRRRRGRAPRPRRGSGGASRGGAPPRTRPSPAPCSGRRPSGGRDPSSAALPARRGRAPPGWPRSPWRPSSRGRGLRCSRSGTARGGRTSPGGAARRGRRAAGRGRRRRPSPTPGRRRRPARSAARGRRLPASTAAPATRSPPPPRGPLVVGRRDAAAAQELHPHGLDVAGRHRLPVGARGRRRPRAPAAPRCGS